MQLRASIKRVIHFSREREEKLQYICAAIKQMHKLEFYYLNGTRTVEPFAVGIVLNNKQDNMSLLCWQTSGFSDLRDVVGWKLYRVSDMEDIEILKDEFTGIRPGYDPQNLEMAKVICCVKKVEIIEEEAKIVPPPEVKAEVPPVIEVTPPPSPPPPVTEKPRAIARVLSHNQLMERFREAHPQPIPELEDLLWPEPLEKPFPEPEKKPDGETPESNVWPDTPPNGLKQAG